MAQINFVKEFRNADIYEILSHEIRIPHKVQYSFRTTNNKDYSPEDGDMLSHKTITIKNKISGATSTKRCYQYEDTLLEELQRDYNGSKSQFIWK
ncbi:MULTISPECIES: hypothetical protein [unclassified Bacillus (in: firmicutes)]|uniref:hypothetical protein n=1 Tax=unclassified Bacillus (in: firmicutes) TaxID=185979 RepID=UPI0008E0BD24|nr:MULTISPECIES: hypothetical protein [unclassified Bacillus (in: firmicutes)]SFB19724.1 hypothetical protein SAMN02799634_10825 [Bacillus sp. UNCCL13]SFQ90729.1 hypothetical protein SAMN04488577_3841 [Bacillus sp. cl95]